MGLSAAVVGAALLLVLTTDPGKPPPAIGGAENVETAPAPDLRKSVFAEKPANTGFKKHLPAAQGASAEPGAQSTTDDADVTPPFVETRVGELQDLAMQDDPDSLRQILSELANPNAQIRKAAIDAAVQFGSRDAIPDLANAADRTTDPEEKKALQDAIDYLKLPSLTEVLQQRKLSSPNQSQPPARPSVAPAPTAPKNG